jgi:hypothetical protein
MLRGADPGKKPMRDLQQHAGTVAAIGLATASPAVVEIGQDPEGLLENGVRLPTL